MYKYVFCVLYNGNKQMKHIQTVSNQSMDCHNKINSMNLNIFIDIVVEEIEIARETKRK